MGRVFRDGLARSVLVGSVFGFLETALSYATGTLPREDGWMPFVAGLVLWAALGTLAAGLLATLVAWRVVAPQAALRAGALTLLVAPVVVLGLRTLEAAERWTRPPSGIRLSLIVLLLALAAAILVLRWGRSGTPGLAGAVLVLAALSSAALARAWGTSPLRRSGPQPQVAGAGEPSVLLIVLDNFRADHLSVYGYPRQTTPALDALASRSLVFRAAYASSPYTLSSHASLFTGLLPSEHGAHGVSMRLAGEPAAEECDLSLCDLPLPESALTLAEELAASGYDTAAIAANHYYLGEWSGLSQGFRHYDCRIARRYGYAPVHVPLAQWWGGPLGRRVLPQPTLGADEVTDRALARLGGLAEPFLLFLNYFDAHAPYGRASDDPRSSGGAPAGDFDWETLERRVLTGEGGLSAAERDELTSRYDGALSFVDAALGRLLRFLEATGRLEPALVIVTSDHGEYLGEHGLVGHANGLHEQVLRIPLIVKLPGQRSRRDVPDRVALQDVPRLVRLVRQGARQPAEILAGLASREPRVVAEFWFGEAARELNAARFGSPVARAVYAGRWKLIESLAGADELYDLASDPGEERNLLEARPGEAAPVRARLLAGQAPLAAIRGDPARRGPPDAEALEALRSLGYAR